MGLHHDSLTALCIKAKKRTIALELNDTGPQQLVFLYTSSLAGQDGLHFGVQRFTLGTAASNCAEASDFQLLSCFLGGLGPLLQRARCPVLLATSGGALGNGLALLVHHQMRLGQSAAGLFLAASQHR